MSNPDKFPHPHIDPTFPQTGSVQKTNPPVFVWNPVRAKDLMHLVIARDPALEERIYDIIELLDPRFTSKASLWVLSHSICNVVPRRRCNSG